MKFSSNRRILPCKGLILLLFLNVFLCAKGGLTPANRSDVSNTANNQNPCEPHHDRITLASFRWYELGVYFTITAFVLIAGLAKLGFHKLNWLSSIVPESCLLILLGLALSAIIYFTTDPDPPPDSCKLRFTFPKFTSRAFFLILLPPVILDSAYSLHDRVFFDNLGSVLLFAVVGTLMSVFAIGPTLYGLSAGGLIPNMHVTLKNSLVFSSLISAVDPVAVLAIFQELGVNQNLYFLVFGESLLNDGVTVVLYNTMKTFSTMDTIGVGQYFLAILSFFIVCFGGIGIGIVYGILTALFTKWTSNVRVMEPLALLGLAYLSYLTAELFHFSGIISLIVCGLIQAHYGFYNISHKSYICVKYFTKMASATSDTIIFMFLGMVLVNENWKWNTAFVLWTNAACLIYRFIAVFILSAIANAYRTKAIQFEEQFIAAYGGLRGAVAFSLATTLDENMEGREIYICTTLVVILFTVFVQGITIKPLVQLLKIKKKNKNEKKSLVEEISETSMDHMMAGIEEVLGHHGDFYLRSLLMHYNEKYLKKWFLHESCDNKLTRLFEKIAMSEHIAHLYGPIAMVEDHMKPLIAFNDKDIKRQSPLTSQEEEMLFRASISRMSQRLSIISTSTEYRRVSIAETIESLQQRLTDELDRQSLKSQLSHINESPRKPSRQLSAVSFFPPMKRAKSMITPSPSAAQQDRQGPMTEEKENAASVLRRALRDNRYNKLHYKYNRNLVNEDDQEISDHLSRRSLNARRMSTIASANYRGKPTPDINDALPGQISSPEHKATYDPLMRSTQILIERHKRRSLIQRDRARRSIRQESIEEERLNEPSNIVSHDVLDHEPQIDEEPEELNKQESIPLLEVLTHKNDTNDSHDSHESINI